MSHDAGSAPSFHGATRSDPVTDGIDVRGNEKLGLEGMRTESAVLMEGILGPDSSLAGKSLKQLNFRQRLGAELLEDGHFQRIAQRRIKRS